MADIISLKTIRKAKARADKDCKAGENRIRFGRTKAEKQKLDAEARLAAAKLGSHKRED